MTSGQMDSTTTLPSSLSNNQFNSLSELFKFKNPALPSFVQIHPADLSPHRPLLKGRFHAHLAACSWMGNHILRWGRGSHLFILTINCVLTCCYYLSSSRCRYFVECLFLFGRTGIVTPHTFRCGLWSQSWNLSFKISSFCSRSLRCSCAPAMLTEEETLVRYFLVQCHLPPPTYAYVVFFILPFFLPFLCWQLCVTYNLFFPSWQWVPWMLFGHNHISWVEPIQKLPLFQGGGLML